MAEKKYLLTVKEAANLTGLSEGWWKQVTAGRRPWPGRVIKIGKAVRIHAGDLQAWVNGEPTQDQPKRRPGRPTKAEQIARVARERQTLRKE